MRCSMLPLVFACPQSRVAPKIEIDVPSEGRETGVAVHAAIAKYIDAGKAEIDVIPEAGRFMFWRAKRFFDKLRGDFGANVVCVEEERRWENEFCRLTGHPDLVLEDRWGNAHIVDWKTGRLDTDYTRQMQGYLLIVGGLRGGYATVVDLREGEKTTRKFGAAEMAKFEDDLCNALASNAYTPGPHCRFCPRAHECDAQTALVKQSVSALSEIKPAEMTLALINDVEPKIDLIEKIVKEYKAARKNYIEENGAVELSDGRVMDLQSVERTKITLTRELAEELGDVLGVKNSEAALEILEDSSALTIDKKKFVAALKENKIDGEKTKEYISRKMADVAKTGAVEKTEYLKIQKRKKRRKKDEEK